MPIQLKAALLSAFVLPGLGQLYKQHRVKGAILLLFVNIFLLGAFFLLMKSMGDLILISAKSSAAPDVPGIIRLLEQKAPAARWALAGFGVVWFYSVIDALVSVPAGANRGKQIDN